MPTSSIRPSFCLEEEANELNFLLLLLFYHTPSCKQCGRNLLERHKGNTVQFSSVSILHPNMQLPGTLQFIWHLSSVILGQESPCEIHEGLFCVDA